MMNDWQARSNDIALLAVEAALLAEKAALESQNQALQERAEKAERERDEARLAWTAANDRLLSLTCADLLSPTQETDPE